MAGISAENAEILRPMLEEDYVVGKELYHKYLTKILNRDATGSQRYKDMLIRHIDKYPLIYDAFAGFEHPSPVRPPFNNTVQSNRHVARWRGLHAPEGHQPLGEFANHAIPRPIPKRARRNLRNYFAPPVERNARLTPITRRNNGNNGNNNNNNNNNNNRSRGGGKKTRRRK